jgi:predicted ATPase
MRLQAAQVENFKLANDTGRFRIDDLTCLVGKNESGKTAVLKALHRLNPDDNDGRDFDIETEYPRYRLFEYKQRHPESPDNVVTSWWHLDDAERRWIADRFGPSALGSDEVVVKRGYLNTNDWTVPIDEAAATRYLVDHSGLSTDEVGRLGPVSSARTLVQSLAALDASTTRDAFARRLQDLVGDGSVADAVTEYLGVNMPTFVYYANYHTLPGQMSLDHFMELEAQNQMTWPEKIFKALLSLVGSSAEDISRAATYEAMKADLEAVSLRLSREIFEYWSQNRDLEVEFAFDQARPADPPPYDSGYVFRTRIRNRRHGVSVSFDERSTGFVWFFSFLIWFSQMQSEHGQDLVLLLDEPGLSLHGTAQADLLRYIRERLAPKCQVIYSTHSPFMVSTNNLLSLRTVEDAVTRTGEVRGTVVGDDVFSNDPETLFPLRAALGYDMTQTMFAGDHCLLVGGPSDLLYLTWASEELSARGRIALDRRWTITPCGGIRKVASFLNLFGANQSHVAVFTDHAPGEKATVRSLREAGLLQDGLVLTADMFVLAQDEADTEDLVGRGLYSQVVNKAFALPAAQWMTRSRVVPARVVKEVEEHFKTLPVHAPVFDRLVPAAYLLEHKREFESDPDLDSALDRFARLFDTLNRFLTSGT